MKQLKVIIADDEFSARENLRDMLEAYCPDIMVVATCPDVDSAYECILETVFDVLFLDINLGLETGFDLLEKIGAERNFQVVFVTAYDQYALKAYQAEAIGYLLKPIGKEALIKCTDRLKKISSNDKVPGNLLSALQTIRRQETKKIMIPGKDGSDIVPAAQIMFLQANGSYTRICLEQGKELFSSKNLKYYEGQLEETGIFIRVHKSYIVNKEHIMRIVKSPPARIILSNEAAIPISEQLKDAVYNIFG